nr:MAG TPA: hypothetical protein [Caudoviricetes sp.]
MIDISVVQKYNFNEIRQKRIIAEKHLKYILEKWICFN